MNSFLRSRLERLHIRYRDEQIPWNILEQFPHAEELITEMIIAKAYPVIKIAMDFPETPHKGNMYKKIEEMVTRHGIDYRILSIKEMEHLVIIAAYKLARRFIKRGHIGNIYKFMAFNLPTYYTRELGMELNPSELTVSDSIQKEEERDDGVNLPSTPTAYMETIKGMGVSNYIKNYSFYNRTHMYRIINQKL